MTKWRIKRLPDVEGKLSFGWSPEGDNTDYKWDWETIEAALDEMEINEEKIIEIL